jgi:hypothetical protein
MNGALPRSHLGGLREHSERVIVLEDREIVVGQFVRDTRVVA